MADRHCPGYVPGIGVPSYLLNRAEDQSSTNSDGASRIFSNARPTTTTVNDTDSLATSHITHSSSSFSMSSFSSVFNTSYNSEQHAFQQQAMDAMSSGYDNLTETVAINSVSISDFSNELSIISERPQIQRVPIPSRFSFMDTSNTGPLCSTKDYQQDWNVPSYSLAPAVSADPAEMFTPYVPYVSPFPENEREIESSQHTQNFSGGLHIPHAQHAVTF